LEKSRIPESVFEPVVVSFECRDFYKETPVSDEVFLAYKERFSYEKSELNSEVEEVNRTSRHWIKERISFDAAYDDERVFAYLYLPKKGVPPFQTAIYFPGIAPWQFSRSSRDELWEEEGMFDFIVKAGRAVMYPIYKGSHERADQDSKRYGFSRRSLSAVEYLIKYVKDFKRCVDYLETRQDIDSHNLAYLGYSRGGELANIITAVEDRLKASVSILGGLYEWEILPALDPFNYVTRVKIPTLMLNGEHDIIYRYQTDAKPMYDLLGTPEKDKVLKLYNTDHHIPKNELIRETLNWLDKYLGPIKPVSKE
jgi:dienelactone hydrolase